MHPFDAMRKLRNPLSRSRMYGKNYIQALAYFDKGLQNTFQAFAVIDIGWPVQRNQGIAFRKIVFGTFAATGRSRISESIISGRGST
jgi:hypothetical protein